MTTFYKSFTILVWTRLVLSTVPSLSFMDLIRQSTLSNKPPGEDLCNPLYWYPKTIPNYCYFKPPVTITITEKPHLSVPLHIPVPLPVPMPHPVSVPLPNPVAPPILMPVPQHFPGLSMRLTKMPSPSPIVPPTATKLALPPSYVQSHKVSIGPTGLIDYGAKRQSHFEFPHPIYETQTDLVPRLPSLVRKNGGINIVPLSEYADMLEKLNNNMIRSKVQRFFNKYEYFPKSRKYIRFLK